MKGKKIVTKASIKNSNNIYSKILACCILVAIFTGYLMPIRSLAEVDKIDRFNVIVYEVEDVEDFSKYIEIDVKNKKVRESLRNQFKWNAFLESDSNTKTKIELTNNRYTETRVRYRYPLTENENLKSFYVPKAWIKWCENELLNTYTIDSADEELGAFDYSKFYAIDTIEVNITRTI